jgi:hypothetical protein
MVEYALLFGGVIIPFTFGLIAMSQLLWVWHTAVEFTRMGARYAATHCWQADGNNVRAWMRANIPPVLDQDAFRSGPAQINVRYFAKDPDSGALRDFSCAAECSTACVPDVVTVRITDYQFRRFISYVGLPAVRMPEFNATVPIESAGCDPDLGSCLP